ncbi:hypothetical protein [Streptomyces sp. AHA2]
MDRAGRALGGDAARLALRHSPRLTSRRHVDLLRVCSAAGPPDGGGPAPA